MREKLKKKINLNKQTEQKIDSTKAPNEDIKIDNCHSYTHTLALGMKRTSECPNVT